MKKLVKKFSVVAAMAFMMFSFLGFKPVNNVLSTIGLDTTACVVYADDVVVNGGNNAGGANMGNGSQSHDAGSGNTNADTAYKSIVSVFIVWIRRIGALVGFVGAIMFALAIKNNDAEQKQSGLLTLVAGFVVWAICLATSIFDLFT